MNMFSKKGGKKASKKVSLSLKGKNIALFQASTYRNLFLYKTWILEIVVLLIAAVVSGTIVVQFFFLWSNEEVEIAQQEQRLAEPLINELELLIENRQTTFENAPVISNRVFPTPAPAAAAQ